MVAADLQNVWVLYRINGDEGNKSLSLLALWRDAISAFFLEY